jgi:N-acetylmuramoyl-L-alanine amidase
MDQSLYFADAIQQQFKSRIESPNRGIKQAGFLVLKKSTVPSVLVEAGFLSNTSEANFLKSEDGQHHIALSVFEAFRKFKNKNSGTSNSQTTEVIVSHPKTQDTATTQEERIEKKSVEPTMNSEKTETIASAAPTIQSNDTYYSVQIGANKTPVEPIASNFKGLKNVRREKSDQYYRYYIGKESSIDNLTLILKQIKLKFPQAFIVSFVDGKRVPLNVASN